MIHPKAKASVMKNRINLALMLLVTLYASAASAQSTATNGVVQPKSAAQILSQAKDQAVEQVLLSGRSDNPFLRANAIEAMQPLPQRALPLAQLGLKDDHPAVRFAALVTVGQLETPGLGKAVQERLDDESPSVRAAAMFAARKLGLNVRIDAMARMLASQDPGLRGNVAMLLGMLGDRSAIPMMQEMAQVPMPRASAARQALARIQVSEAVLKLGDNTALDAVRAGAYSSHDEVRVLAVMIMGRTGDQRMQPAIRQMLENAPIELRLAAAEALARMGDDRGLSVALEGAKSQLEAVRSQTAFTLALFRDPAAARALVTLLEDPVEQVRLSAAAAILEGL